MHYSLSVLNDVLFLISIAWMYYSLSVLHDVLFLISIAWMYATVSPGYIIPYHYCLGVLFVICIAKAGPNGRAA